MIKTQELSVYDATKQAGFHVRRANKQDRWVYWEENGGFMGWIKGGTDFAHLHQSLLPVRGWIPRHQLLLLLCSHLPLCSLVGRKWYSPWWTQRIGRAPGPPVPPAIGQGGLSGQGWAERKTPLSKVGLDGTQGAAVSEIRFTMSPKCRPWPICSSLLWRQSGNIQTTLLGFEN